MKLQQNQLGTVSGLVIDHKSGEPVRKAVVILHATHDPKTIGVTTNTAGEFTLQDVEPGAYTVSVERGGYVLAREHLSQIVTVRAGETTRDVKLKLLCTGVISGRVLDTDGEPVTGANVQISPFRQNRSGPDVFGPRPGLWPRVGSWATTDDRGEYRAFHIVPGQYRISATYNVPRHVDMLQPSASGAGRTFVSAYPTVYYPGTLDIRQATVVTVEPGNNLQGFDLHLMRQHAVRVRGRLTGMRAISPVSFAMIILSPIGREPGQSRETLVRDPEGKFELPDVLPGTYRLSATAGALNEQSRLTGHRTLDVGETDVESIDLAVGVSRKLNGHVLAPKERKIPTGLMVMLESREPGDTQAGGMTSVGADGSFAIDDVPPGEYSVIVNTTGDADDLYVSAIHHGDADALAQGVSIGEVPPASLDILLKANGGSLEAAVNGEDGKAAPAALVLLVPDAPRQGQMALYGNCQAGVNGICHITGITPGEFHVFAFPTQTAINHRAPDALKAFEKYGKAVKFAEGEKQTIELSAAPLE